MKYFGVPPRHRKNRILTNQWIETDDNKTEGYRWVNFMENSIACGPVNFKTGISTGPHPITAFGYPPKCLFLTSV